MGFFSKITGRSGKVALSRPIRNPSLRRSRLDLLASAVQDTVLKHGIPQSWIATETFAVKTSSDLDGVHLRLIIKNAHPRLLTHLVALQRTIEFRLSRLDPQSGQWMMGTSWRVDVPPGADIADLPGPAFWQPEKSSTAQSPVAESSRAQLARTLEGGDKAFARTTWDAPEFGPTLPMAHLAS